ncbi:MAG TPA: hypothetical protein VLM40_01280, partial [Gemmata sp.]|nr:hypothetical protein [Gemmata sp.]
MPTLKVRCPDCDANIRQSVDAVDQPTDVELTCPKCGKEFFAIADPEVKPRARRTDDEDETNSRKPAKAARRYQDDDDDDEDNDFARRRRRRETEADGANRTLLFGAIGGGVLLVAGIVVAVILLGGKKKTDTAQTNTPSQVDQKQMPPRPGPGLGGTSGGTGTSPNRPLIGNGGTGQSVPPQGNGSQGSSQPPKKDPPKKDPPRKTVETNPDLPPPPVIRISGSLAPTGTFSTPVEKPPPAPPLQPDEDPFVRAKKYVLTAQLPQLPKLPPAAQRPLLTLDPGGHSAFVVKAFVTPLGEQVITVGKDKAIRVWNLATGEAIRTIRLPAGLTEEGELEAAAMSPDGKQLAVAGKPLKATRKGSVPIFILNL